MQDFMASIDGYKTYLALIFGATTIVVNHFFGPIYGVNLDPANWLSDGYNLLLVATARSALKK